MSAWICDSSSSVARRPDSMSSMMRASMSIYKIIALDSKCVKMVDG
jgi:hypothetical protein